jgi:hypothetical protein
LHFVKRDIVLLAATIMIVFGVAALPSMTLLHGIGIGIAIFFGIKAFVTQREKTMEKQVGEGYCAECGEKIQRGKCPHCDESKFQK